jgi:hypothetical protein
MRVIELRLALRRSGLVLRHPLREVASPFSDFCPQDSNPLLELPDLILVAPASSKQLPTLLAHGVSELLDLGGSRLQNLFSPRHSAPVVGHADLIVGP